MRPVVDGAAALDVLNVVHAYFSSADAGDWALYRRLHADRIEVDFGGVNDDSDGEISADAMLESARGLLDPVQLRQHMISNEVVEVDGDQASVSFYEQALHHHPGLGEDPSINTWVVYGRGLHRLRRFEDGWKLTAATLVAVHHTGNVNLLADVANLAAVSR